MDERTYTIGGEEVALGVECALPFCADAPMRREQAQAAATYPIAVSERDASHRPLWPRLRLVSD